MKKKTKEAARGWIYSHDRRVVVAWPSCTRVKLRKRRLDGSCWIEMT